MINTTLYFLLALAFRQVAAVPLDQIVAEHPTGFVVTESSQGRIVSGWEAQPGQHPHQVSLRLMTTAGTMGNCGGSVVHRQWVVSAAHCTANIVSVVVLAGVTHVSRPEVTQESQEMYNYPTFDESRASVAQPNDISLIKLPQPLEYSSNLRSIRIQPSSDAFRDYNGALLYASGFGRIWTDGPTSESLLWVYLRGVANPACQQLFGPELLTENSICATFYNVTSQSICQGDSGGPLVNVEDDGTPTLVGVTSFVAGGIYGCHSGIPGGFIRPGPFHSWFTQITGIDFNNLDEEEEEEPSTTTALPETTVYITTAEPESSETTISAPSTTTPAPPSTTPPSIPEEEDESEEMDDPEIADLLKRLEVKVKVKVRLSKYLKKKINEQKVISH